MSNHRHNSMGEMLDLMGTLAAMFFSLYFLSFAAERAAVAENQNLTEQVQIAEADNDRLEGEITETRGVLANLKRDHDKVKVERDNADRSRKNAQQERDKARAERNKAWNERYTAQRQRDDANNQKRQAEDERDAATKAQRTAQYERDAAKRAQKKAETAKADAEKAKDDAENAQAQANLARVQAERELDKIKSELDRTKKSLSEAYAENERYRGQIADANERFNRIKINLDDANTYRTDAQAQVRFLQGVLQRQQDDTKKLSQKLIGLKGPFGPTNIVLDFSKSMEERLDAYRKEVELLLMNLPFKQFKLTTFFGYAKDNNQYVSVKSWQHEWQDPLPEIRRQAVAYVNQHEASGGTPTLSALLSALKDPEVDTIVFISDGQPDGKPEDILKGVREANIHDCVINVIAMGQYFNHEYGTFLAQLAEQNGGQFLGR